MYTLDLKTQKYGHEIVLSKSHFRLKTSTSVLNFKVKQCTCVLEKQQMALKGVAIRYVCNV